MSGDEMGEEHKWMSPLEEVLDALRGGGYNYVKLPDGHLERQFDASHGIDADPGPRKGALISLASMPPNTVPERELWVELGRLVEAARNSGYDRAYLVLTGEGWTLDDAHLVEAISGYLPPPELHILWPGDFAARWMAGRL